MNKSERTRLYKELDALRVNYSKLWTELASVNYDYSIESSIGTRGDYISRISERMHEVRSAMNTIEWVLWKLPHGSPMKSEHTKLVELREVYGSIKEKESV